MKKQSKVDTKLIKKIKRGLEDIKHGRVRPWKKKFID